MNWRSIWAIARKDLKEVRQNKAGLDSGHHTAGHFCNRHTNNLYCPASGDPSK